MHSPVGSLYEPPEVILSSLIPSMGYRKQSLGNSLHHFSQHFEFGLKNLLYMYFDKTYIGP